MSAFLIFIVATVLGIVLLVRRISKSQAAGRSLNSLGLRIAGVVIIQLLLLMLFGYLLLGLIVFLTEPEAESIPITVHLITSGFALVYGILLYLVGRMIPTYPEDTGILDD